MRWPWRAIAVELEKPEAATDELSLALDVQRNGVVQVFVRHKKRRQWHCHVSDWPSLHRDDAERKQLLDMASSASLSATDLAHWLYFGSHVLSSGARLERKRLRLPATLADAKSLELRVDYTIASSASASTETLLTLVLPLQALVVPRRLVASSTRREPPALRVTCAKSAVKTFPTRYVNWAIEEDAETKTPSLLRAVSDGLQLRERGDYEITLTVESEEGDTTAAPVVLVELDGECLTPEATHNDTMQLFLVTSRADVVLLRVLIVHAPAPCDAEIVVRQTRRSRRAQAFGCLRLLLLSGLEALNDDDDGKADD
ncbi:hypothetical protein PINS_up009852 [Pythium insidiosum]|nr:hypothetical protein PINS_up009852 [Pythium insidiosum]